LPVSLVASQAGVVIKVFIPNPITEVRLPIRGIVEDTMASEVLIAMVDHITEVRFPIRGIVEDTMASEVLIAMVDHITEVNLIIVILLFMGITAILRILIVMIITDTTEGIMIKSILMIIATGSNL